MSTLATANFDSSEDEADADFIPSAPKSGTKRKSKDKGKAKATRMDGASGSESDSGSSSDSEDNAEDGGEGDDDDARGEVKRLKTEQEEERRRKAKEAFAAFAAPDSAGGTGTGTIGGTASGGGVRKELIKVERTRRFAGETIRETVELPSDDPDAIAYLASQTTEPAAGQATDEPNTQTLSIDTPSVPNSEVPLPDPAPSASVAAIASGKADPSSTSGPSPSSTQAAHPTLPAPPSVPETSSSAAVSSSTALPAKRPPPKRKPRQSLEAMSAALDKGTKMTTLEKSQMDWKSHTSSTKGMADELADNRRAGGYLEKKDFLERVDDRRTGAFESNKKGGRR